MKKLQVLIADDDPGHRAMLATMLTEWGYKISRAGNGREAVDKTLAGSPDMVILDVRMPEIDGLQAMKLIKEKRPDIPVLIMTAYSDIPAAVEAIRAGAFDYLPKPLDFDKLKIAMRNASTQLVLARENAQLAASLAAGTGKSLQAESRVMLDLVKMTRAIAPTEATVLITGESGTGKELAARAIHEASNRASGPFVAINCGALTDTLLSSELFGHEKGAFTGADKKHPGLFLKAKGGSLFLDEVGEMTPAMQIKLLRVLQEREVLSVGGTRPEPIDCRIIAATNRDLAREVEEGNFRQDLFYRLNVVTLEMPPLRARKEDIPLLAQNFATRFAALNRKPFSGISPRALGRLQAWDWPGNVRELENVMERAVILMPGDYIDERELPERIQAGRGRQIQKADAASSRDGEGGLETLEEVEKRVILNTLRKLGNNKTEAARALGITRKTLHLKLNRYKEEKDG